MAEVLGGLQTAQAACQLIDWGAKIASLLHEIHQYSRKGNQARPCDEPYESIGHLVILATSVRDNVAFHDSVISSILQGCITEALALHKLLESLLIGAKDSMATRYKKGIAWKRNEQRINAHFARIERKKTSLLLGVFCIDATTIRLLDTRFTKSGDGMFPQATVVHGVMAPDKITPDIIVPCLHKKIEQGSFPKDRVRNRDFVGQDAALRELGSKFETSDKHNRAVLVGLGGIGKSQIALEYAFRLHESEPRTSIFWIDASDSTHLEQDYLRILVQAEVVNIESSVSPNCEDVKKWLASREAGSWLIIVDGADNKDLLSGSRSLSELIPRNPHGSVIFTTRNKQLGLFLAPPADVVLLSGLSPPDARHLLAITSGQPITEEAHINELLSSLEYLPLAICQAGSFMALNSISSLGYLHFFNHSESSKIQLLSEDFEDHGRTGATNTRPVVLTWKVSFEQIKKNNTLAAQLLSLIAFLDHQRVHKALLAPIASEIELAKALGLLQSYSLINMDAKHDFIDIHRLVHLATRNWLESEDMFMESIKSCFDAIPRYHSSVCSPYDDLDACVNLRARNSTQPSNESSFMKDEAQALLALQVSQYLQTLGYYDSAAINANTAVCLGKKASGERSQSTLAKLSNLGIVYRYQGKHHAAREVTEQVLHARIQTLGPEDPRTLASMNNMAWILNAMGEYGKAEEIYQETLKVQEKVLGTENTDILITLSNLAVSLQSSGRYQAAEEIYRRVLKSRALNLGTDHPETLSSISNLGVVYHLQGNVEEAEKWHEKALRGRERILGPKHHRTLDSMSHLGCVFHSQHRFEAAEDLFRKVLDGHSTRYGTEHPTTLRTMSNLAIILQCQEKYQEAEDLVRKVLKLRENTLGEGHRDTLFSANHLEGLLGIRECLED